MYLITGDCYRDFSKIEMFCKNRRTSQEDVMILLGDVGLNLNLDESDRRKKQQLAEQPFTFLCIHGNHEARPYSISTYCEMEWRGGAVYYEPDYPNILFAKDGSLFDFDGKNALVIGGAYSIDREFRLMTGQQWFTDEQPSGAIKTYVEEQLERCQWKVDYVFSHTCPMFMVPMDLFLPHIDQNKVDHSTEEWLEYLYKRMSFKTWYFGHYHDNRSYAQFEMLFEEIKELGSGEVLQRLGYPKYKYGERVLFYFSDGTQEYECYGTIEIVDRFGTFGQSKEVSYDILGPDYLNPEERVLYKHIEESRIEKLEG